MQPREPETRRLSIDDLRALGRKVNAQRLNLAVVRSHLAPLCANPEALHIIGLVDNRLAMLKEQNRSYTLMIEELEEQKRQAARDEIGKLYIDGKSV